ncbi:AMP-dependent synthetase and ligase [Flagelloscypha sp. PMI_526]|nr:AMP-dependent synthetase and ligase [Flagelloscypha sp. PMI_526]
MVVLPTGPENALALLSLACYHSCAPVNASCTAAELKEDAIRLRAKAVVTTKEAVDRLELRSLQMELDCDIVFIEGRSEGPAGLFAMDVLGSAVLPPQPSRLHGLNDKSLILHTSGTSGKKKVVPYTLRSLIIGAWAVVHSWNLHESDVNMNMMPLFHVGGIVRNLLAPMLSGGSAIVCAGFDPIAFWNLATTLSATWYYAAPTIHHSILQSKPENVHAGRDTSIRMICNAAGGLLPSLAVDMKEIFTGAVILPSYGMTECMPIASPLQSYQLERPGCSGIACGPYLSIRDPFDKEKELPIGQTGAVSVRGLPTFEGYEVSPDSNVPLDVSAFSTEGWFDSGDCGYMDCDGYLYITGRSKEIINKGGEVISPFEVEEAIMTAAHDLVKACPNLTTLAFGIEHDVLQECIGVVIVPQPDRPRIGLLQLQDLLRDHLHPSKWPFAVVYMNDLPKNAAGKPLRIKLAPRLGLGPLADSTPLLERHIEAEVPAATAALTEPIAAQRVEVDPHRTQAAFASIPNVCDVGMRFRNDGVPEAFVSVTKESGLRSDQIRETLTHVLHGYCIPHPIHVLTTALSRTAAGHIDFEIMERLVMAQNAAGMSDVALTVRDIFSSLLNVDAANITKDSDFFLLGGNSLLLGKLSYLLRKQTGADLGVADLFTNSTLSGIVGLIEASDYVAIETPALTNEKYHQDSVHSSTMTLGYNYGEPQVAPRSRGQNHPLSLLIQAIPVMFFYPLKSALTWTTLLFVLSYEAPVFGDSWWSQMGALLIAIIAARFTARVVAPITAIIFKWLVIGRFKRGIYKTWSWYYLRWWLVNQSLRLSGRGIFSAHPKLERMYYRLLGTRIGRDVEIDKSATLGEYDLLTIEDGARLDKCVMRAFCVEREGCIRLDPIIVGRGAVINTYTHLSPGSRIPENSVLGPHASTHEPPAPKSFAAYNRTTFEQPWSILKMLIAWPIFLGVFVASYVPWITMIWLMIGNTTMARHETNALRAVIVWFSTPERVMWHAIARVVRAIATPLIQLVLGLLVKRILGLNKPVSCRETGQFALLRRYINSTLLSQRKLKNAFGILGTHYQMVSIVYRAMGAKIGERVYWPGSGIYCPDPELLEVGNDVVFGSRSEIFTTDRLGSSRITIGDGAMIADRVVLLPGTTVGRRTVMGSGALGKRDAVYEDGSTWMGSEGGQAICFSKGKIGAELPADEDTITPFGRAYYRREANFFVFPYPMLVLINLAVVTASATYWSISAVAAAQMLLQLMTRLRHIHLFSERWYRFAILYGWISIAFIVVLNIQAILAIFWVIMTKWIVIGRRKDGRYDWDKNSYCQRWQFHLTLSRIIYKGYGNGGILAPIAGSAYIVWYYRMLGAKIGKNCGVWVGGKVGLMTEPDLVTLGNEVNLDNSSVVAHINSRGNFSLNSLKLGDGCAMRNGSRLLSGASMEDNSLLCEHTLLPSGEIAESGSAYAGWPARRIDLSKSGSKYLGSEKPAMPPSLPPSLDACPKCHRTPDFLNVTTCGHLLCEDCLMTTLTTNGRCPECRKHARTLTRVVSVYAANIGRAV